MGLGTGSDRPEHAAYGYPFGTPGERTAGLVAALDTMRAMATAPDGPMPNQPPAVQRPGPPIWLAAHKPRLLRLAGERADGIVVGVPAPRRAGGPSRRRGGGTAGGGSSADRLLPLHVRVRLPHRARGPRVARARGRGARHHAGRPAAVASHHGNRGHGGGGSRPARRVRGRGGDRRRACPAVPGAARGDGLTRPFAPRPRRGGTDRAASRRTERRAGEPGRPARGAPPAGRARW